MTANEAGTEQTVTTIFVSFLSFFRRSSSGGAREREHQRVRAPGSSTMDVGGETRQLTCTPRSELVLCEPARTYACTRHRLSWSSHACEPRAVWWCHILVPCSTLPGSAEKIQTRTQTHFKKTTSYRYAKSRVTSKTLLLMVKGHCQLLSLTRATRYTWTRVGPAWIRARRVHFSSFHPGSGAWILPAKQTTTAVVISSVKWQS